MKQNQLEYPLIETGVDYEQSKLLCKKALRVLEH